MRRPSERLPESGAVLLEAVIVFLQLAMMLFGIIEVGVTFKEAHDASAVAQGGVRVAAASPRDPYIYTKTLAAVKNTATDKLDPGATLYIYSASASGLPAGGTCGSKCQAYTWNGTDFVASGGGGWPWGSHIVCPATKAEFVGVMVKQNHKSITGLLKDAHFDIEEKSVAKFEARYDVC